MVSPAEIRAMQAALDRALPVVESQERKASESGFWGWITQDAPHRQATTARALYDSAVRQRDFVIEDPEPRHEEALAVIERANHAADPTWVAEATATKGILESAGEAVGSGLSSLIGGAKRGLGIEVPWWIKAGIVVVGLLIIAYLVAPIRQIAKGSA